jgi:hypothetical protein
MTLRVGVFIAALMVGAGACSSTDGADNAVAEEIVEQVIEEENENISDVESEDDSISFTVEDEEGAESEVQIGTGSEVPDGFPAPVPPGGDVQQSVVSSGSQGAWNLVVSYSADRFEELVETYESWLNAEGYQAQKLEQPGPPRSVSLIGQGDQPPGASIVIIEGTEGDLILNVIVPN